MSRIVPQGIYSELFDVIPLLTAACYNLISNSIDFGSKIVHKIIAVGEMSTPVDAYFI